MLSSSAAQPAQAPAAGFGGQGGFGAPRRLPPAPQQGGFRRIRRATEPVRSARTGSCRKPCSAPRSVRTRTRPFADNNTDAFGMSRSAGEGTWLRDFLGQPLRSVSTSCTSSMIRTTLVSRRSRLGGLDCPGSRKPRSRWRTPASGTRRSSTTCDTVNSGRRYHLGRPVEVPTKHPQPAIVLHPISDEEETLRKRSRTRLELSLRS